MEGNKRREVILSHLSKSKQPVSGSELAKVLGVSRQVIVQDMALLRAVDEPIISTTKGYVLQEKPEKKATRCFWVQHKTDEIEDELCTIVDFGGKVLDVIVMHPVYGQIRTELSMQNRQDVYDFMEQVNEKQTTPLKELTDGVHMHTVEAETEGLLDRIEKALHVKNYLIQQ